MVKHITLSLSILLLLTVYPHTSSFTAVPTQQRYKQNNKPQQQFSFHTLQQATFVTMPSDSEEPKQKKVKTDESAAKESAGKSEEDVSVDVQRNDDGTCLS